MTPTEGVHTTADGLRIGYRRWGEQPRTLICVHGLLRNGHDFDTLAAALADQYTVICPDMVGRGASERAASPARYTVPHYAHDVLGLIGELQLGEVDFLGTSMGALIGMAIAAQPGSPVRRLILNDAAPQVSFEALQGIADRARKAPLHFDSLSEAEAFMRRAYSGLGALTDAQWRKFTLDSVRPDAEGVSMHYDPQILATQDAPPGGLDVWDLYCAIQCPVLVLRGAESPIVSREVAARMHAPPTTTVVEIPGCGHAPPLLSAREIELVRNFLNEPVAQPLPRAAQH